MSWTVGQRAAHSVRMTAIYADPSLREACRRRALGQSSAFTRGQQAWNKGVATGPSEKHCKTLPAAEIAQRTATRRARNDGRYTSADARGWTASAETRARISEANRLRDLTGSRNPAWRGGRSFEPYPPEFNGRLKTRVLQEQHNLCADCDVLIGRRKGARRANVHHIDGDKKNCARENLIGLCVPCHMKREWQATRRLTTSGHLVRSRVVPVDGDVANNEGVVGCGLDNATH